MKVNDMPLIDSLRRKWKRSISTDMLKTRGILSIGEGEIAVLTYTSTCTQEWCVDKMRVFASFIREGLENGDAICYLHPEEDSETIRSELKKYGIDVAKYEKNGTIFLRSLAEHSMSDGRFHLEKAVQDTLDFWNASKRKGYKHVRHIEDVGDFSVLKGQWRRYIEEYWWHPKWSDPVQYPEWIKAANPVGVVYVPFVMEITAIDVGDMEETQVIDILKTFGKGTIAASKFIDIIECESMFSRSIGLDHKRLAGRKILLEFDPTSNYEKVIHNLVDESMANIEPIFVFSSSTNPIHTHLAKHPAVKFFLTSLSTSIPKSSSENTVLLPAKNAPLILDATSKMLETYKDANVCFVFDILSELLTTVGREKTFSFLRQAWDMLSSEKITSLFLLNTGAHDAEVVSRLRNLFNDQLVYDKNGLKVVKSS
jgi:hypothetical protein